MYGGRQADRTSRTSRTIRTSQTNQTSRTNQTSLTSLTCPKARMNQKSKNRQTTLKGVSHFFTFSPFHLFTFKICLLLVLNQQNLGIEQKNTHYLQVYNETFTNFASSKVSTAHYEKRNYKKNVCQGKGTKYKFVCTLLRHFERNF